MEMNEKKTAIRILVQGYGGFAVDSRSGGLDLLKKPLDPARRPLPNLVSGTRRPVEQRLTTSAVPNMAMTDCRIDFDGNHLVVASKLQCLKRCLPSLVRIVPSGLMAKSISGSSLAGLPILVMDQGTTLTA